MNIIERIQTQKCGFVQDTDLPEIIAHNRMQLLIIRCGAGRFMCPAQDVEHFVGIVEREKSDYVRDISLYALPATSSTGSGS